jgi:DNA repair protein RadC
MSLLLMGANKFVLVHNHPNNIMEPSKADINLGSKVKLGTELLELTFVDQIIIGEEDFCSMSAEGYM